MHIHLTHAKISEAPRGYLFRYSPEINWLVPLFPKKSKICFLMFPVPQYCICPPQNLAFVPLFPWNKCPVSPVSQTPWEGLISGQKFKKLFCVCLNYLELWHWWNRDVDSALYAQRCIYVFLELQWRRGDLKNVKTICLLQLHII